MGRVYTPIKVSTPFGEFEATMRGYEAAHAKGLAAIKAAAENLSAAVERLDRELEAARQRELARYRLALAGAN